MKEKQLVIYDTDEFYATRLEQFLAKREGNYFDIFSFSDRYELENKCGTGNKILPEILLVSESSFYEEISKTGAKHIFILNETGLKHLSGFANFSKYQSANTLFQQILLEYAEREKDIIPRFYGNKKARIIGVYTPITRCLQTGFSFSLAQSFGKRGRTLYINFEQYSGFSKLFKKGYIKDLSDLVYYFSYSRDKFMYWLGGVVEHFKNADYIPPVLTAVSLAEVKKEVWLGMLDAIAADTEYEYIVLDLNENVQGIFQILDLCHIVYTIERNDNISVAKLSQFREILKEDNYKHLSEKITYLNCPVFGSRELGFEEMLHGELYEYTDKLVKEIVYEERRV